jgi:hypothetical protein
MHFPRKRLRLALGAALAALAVSVTVAGPASAAEPGEMNWWAPENVGNPTQQLAARGHITEARNSNGNSGTNLLQVWRGENNNNVWLSMNGGNPFTLGTTATYVSPTVVPYGNDSFMVIHTGTDGNIYDTVVYADGTWDGAWLQVPYQSTNNAVSATQMGAGSSNVMMVYRGTSNQNVYSTMYLGNTDGAQGWQPAVQAGGGTTFTGPGVTYNPVSGIVYAVIRGLDNQVWMNSIANGQWGSWTGQGIWTYNTPEIAANDQTGNMLVSAVGRDSNTPQYRAYTQWGNARDFWSPDITGWQTVYAVGLSLFNGYIYALITGQNGLTWWKPVYNG